MFGTKIRQFLSPTVHFQQCTALSFNCTVRHRHSTSILLNRKTVDLLKLPYPIGTVQKHPFETYLITERIVHAKHTNNFRVLGAKFIVPTLENRNTKRIDEENYTNEVDVSKSIDALLQKEEKSLHSDSFNTQMHFDIPRSDPFMRRDTHYEARKYLRTLFASTNSRIPYATVARLSVPSNLSVEAYFESSTETDLAYEVQTMSITELRNVDIEEVEFNTDNGTVEMRLIASTAKVVTDRSSSVRFRRRRNALIGLMIVLAIACLVQYSSNTLNERNEYVKKQNEEAGIKGHSGEDVSKRILEFAANQSENREPTELERRMQTTRIPAVERIKQQGGLGVSLGLKKRDD